MNTQNTRFGVGSSIRLSDSYFGMFLDRTSFTDQSSMFQKLNKMAQIYGGHSSRYELTVTLEGILNSYYVFLWGRIRRGTPPPREKHGKMHENDHILEGQSGDTNGISSKS